MAEGLDQNQQPIQDSVVSEAQTVAESNGVVAEPSVEADESPGQSLEPEPATVLSQDKTVVEPTDQLEQDQEQSAQLQDEFEVPQDPLLDEQGTQLEADVSESQEPLLDLDPEAPTVVEADTVVLDPLVELKRDTQQQYAQLLGEFEKNPDLTWDDIQSRINENPELVNELDQKVVDQAANNGIELEAVQGLVTTDVNFDAFEQGTAVQPEVSESQGQYTELLSEALEEDLTYADIQKYISEDPQLQEYYDELVVLQGQENGMTEDEARGIVSKASKPEDLDPLRMINEDIVEKLSRHIEIGNLRVILNQQEIFRLNGDGMIDHNRSSVNLEQAQMIQDALRNPGNFKGTLTIKVGTRTVLRIQDGIAIPDRYNLAGKDIKAEADIPKDDQQQGQDELAGFTKEQKGAIGRMREKGKDPSKLIAKIQKNNARVPVEQKEQPKREVAMSR